MTFVNLTPHAIHVVLASGSFDIPASGKVARCVEKSEVVGEVGGVTLTTTSYGNVQDVPEPVENVMYIVSFMVRAACPKRKDLISPGKLVRDAEGKIIGCETFNVNV